MSWALKTATREMSTAKNSFFMVIVFGLVQGRLILGKRTCLSILQFTIAAKIATKIIY